MNSSEGLSGEAITTALQTLGLGPGAVVLVHSSLSSMGWVGGGATTVVAALLDAVAPGGTVLAPTLTGTPRDSPRYPPAFDPEASPGWTGAIPETLRRRKDALRSRHPTHSVAGIGPATTALIAGHERCATPCAADSPYGRLAEREGYILLLGVTHHSNTSLHMVEEVGAVPYHLQRRRARARVRRPDGGWDEIPTTLHLWRWERDFVKVEPLLRADGAQRDGLVGRATARLVAARPMRDLLVPLVQHAPLFLLADEARGEYERT